MITFNVGARTDTGQVRQTNQDHLLAEPANGLFAVADGMGGHRGGEVASEVAISALKDSFVEPTETSLVSAVQQANAAIVERANQNPELLGMGTTLCAMAIVQVDLDGDGVTQPVLGIANVGDSRLYLLEGLDPDTAPNDGLGHLRQITEDHSLVATLERQGQLTKAEAAIHPHRNILTKALGIDSDVVPDMFTSLPFAGDRYLICSDGLFNEVTEERIVEILRELTDPQAAADELVRLANENGGRDNISVVVVDIVDDGGRADDAAAVTQRLVRTVHGGEVVLAPEVTQSMVAPAAPPEPAAPAAEAAPEPSAAAAAEAAPPDGQAAPAWDPTITTTVSSDEMLMPVEAPPVGEPAEPPPPPTTTSSSDGPPVAPGPADGNHLGDTDPVPDVPPRPEPAVDPAPSAAGAGPVTEAPAPPVPAADGGTASPEPAPPGPITAEIAAPVAPPPDNGTVAAPAPVAPAPPREAPATDGFADPRRRSGVTWRVVAFLLVFLLIVAAVVAAVVVLGRQTCTVTVVDGVVVEKTGLVGATEVARPDVDVAAVQRAQANGENVACGADLARFPTSTVPDPTLPPGRPTPSLPPGTNAPEPSGG